jgi:hypothetical protein
MAPFIALSGLFLLFAGLGVAGVHVFAEWFTCLRLALAGMFLLTASAHWGKRRPDLVRMVPRAFRRPELLVTLTGLLELLGAIGLLLRPLAPLAAAGLSLLLLDKFHRAPWDRRARRATLRARVGAEQRAARARPRCHRDQRGDLVDGIPHRLQLDRSADLRRPRLPRAQAGRDGGRPASTSSASPGCTPGVQDGSRASPPTPNSSPARSRRTRGPPFPPAPPRR